MKKGEYLGNGQMVCPKCGGGVIDVDKNGNPDEDDACWNCNDELDRGAEKIVKKLIKGAKK